ncbi:MAG: hypothetical protein Q6I77_02185, partial [Gloeomargarita sp. DG_1_4_bins_134]
GESDRNKPYALSVLHQLGYQGEGRYDKFLCGVVQGGAVPSPVWIADFDGYELVTVFGATQDPRRQYLEKLKEKAKDFMQIWPF